MGWVLVAAGLIVIVWALYASYNIFTGKNSSVQNIVVAPGYADEEQIKRFGVTGARFVAIRQAAKNLFDGFREFEKQNPDSNIHLLLVN